MSDLQQVFKEWAFEVDEQQDRVKWSDATAINIRVGPHTLAGLDGLASLLGVSRAKVTQRIVETGVHEATRGAGLMVTIDDSGQWVAAEDVTPKDAG